MFHLVQRKMPRLQDAHSGGFIPQSAHSSLPVVIQGAQHPASYHSLAIINSKLPFCSQRSARALPFLSTIVPSLRQSNKPECKAHCQVTFELSLLLHHQLSQSPPLMLHHTQVISLRFSAHQLISSYQEVKVFRFSAARFSSAFVLLAALSLALKH